KATGPQQTGLWKAGVRIPRNELSQLQRLVDALAGQIPGLLRPFLTPLIQSVVDYVKDKLGQLIDLRGTGEGHIVYWSDQPDQLPPDPACPNGNTIPAGRYATAPLSIIIGEKEVVTLKGQPFLVVSGTTRFLGTITLTSDGSKVTGAMRMHGDTF